MNNKLSRLSSVILDTKIHGTMIKVLNEYKLEICQLSFFVTERRAYSLSLPSENMDSHNLMPLLGCDCIYFMRCPWYLDTCPQSQQWQRGSVLFFFLFVMFLFKRMYLEPEIKWPTSVGSSKKRESSRKTSTSAVLTTQKPLTVWITTNCGKFFKRWEYQTT